MQMKSKAREGKERGFSAVAVVLTITSIFAIMAAGIGNLVLQRTKGQTAFYFRKRSHFAAQAGLRMALQVLADGDPRATNNAGIHEDPGQVMHMLLNVPTDQFWEDNYSRVPLAPGSDAVYTVRVQANLDGQTPIQASDNTWIPAGQAYIRVLGEVRPKSGRGGGTYFSTLGGLATPGNQRFRAAILADHEIEIRNSRVDAYYSRTPDGTRPGPLAYPKIRVEKVVRGRLKSVPVPTLVSGMAIIASNATSKAITMEHSIVDGRVYVGAGASMAAAWLNDGFTHPSAEPLPSPLSVGRYSPPDCGANQGPVIVTGGASRDLAPGHYGSVQASGDSHIRLVPTKVSGFNDYFIDGDLTLNVSQMNPQTPLNSNTRFRIYVSGNVELTNYSKLNAYGWPTSVMLFPVGNGTPDSTVGVLINQGSSAWAMIGSAQAKVAVLNRSHVFGAIKAYSVRLLNKSGVHYDVSSNGQDRQLTGGGGAP